MSKLNKRTKFVCVASAEFLALDAIGIKKSPMSFMPILFLLCVSAYGAADDVGKTEIHTFPGTGVSIEISGGMKPGPIGTYLVNESGTTILVIVAGPTKFSLEDDETYRRLFSDAPQKIPGLGNLYRRTRAQHGGGWDGWWLSAVRGETVLNVQAFYTGTDPDEFEALKKRVASIQWKEGLSDPERAFGLTTSIPNLHIVGGGFGGLSFTVDGQAGTKGHHLLLQAMPVLPGKGDVVVPAACISAFAAAFRGQSYTGSNELKVGGIVACDAWSTEPSGNTRYMALLLMPTGAVVSATGTGDPLQLRSSLLALHTTR